MTQVALKRPTPQQQPPSKTKHTSYLSSGRGGSGNIRRLKNCEKADHPPVAWPANRGDRRTSLVSIGDNRSVHSAAPSAETRRNADQRSFLSSGRGGSGNIQPPAADLEAHPLTASIMSQHGAMQAQYEQWIRRSHAESKLVHSSGRGGSGNINDLRRPRCRSQGSGPSPKKLFFTTKGRNRSVKFRDSGTESQPNGDGHRDRDNRTSFVTCSTGSHDVDLLVGRRSQDSRLSEAVASSINSVASDPFSVGEAITGRTGRRESGNFSMYRWSRRSSTQSTSSAVSPASTLSLRTESYRDSSGSSRRVYSPSPLILEDEDEEYVSFLDLW